MSVVRFDVDARNLAPEEPREVTHTVDGTLLRAEILEADSRQFKARILEPFEQVIEKWVPLFMLYMTDFSYVRDGRRTSILEKDLQQTMETAFHEWRQREGEKEHFLANREFLEPLTTQAHQEAAEVIRDLEDVVKDLQSVGEILQAEFCRLRNGLRNRFKSGAIDQKEFQSSLKVLREKGPETESAVYALTKADELLQRFRTLKALLKETEEAFAQNAGIGLGHAAALAGLVELQLGEWLGKEPRDRLKGLSNDVYSLLRRTS